MEHRRRLTSESSWQREDESTDRVRRGDRQWQDDRLVSAGPVHGEHGGAVAARAVPVDGLALDRVVDLAPFIAGREAAIRAARGDA